jgi:hypothetical protein
VCQQHVLGGSPLLQKRAYRVLAYLAACRPDWLRGHLQAMLEVMLLASAVSLSPAKRYRLRSGGPAACVRGRRLQRGMQRTGPCLRAAGRGACSGGGG